LTEKPKAQGQSVSVPLYSLQIILQGLPWDQTVASEMRCQRPATSDVTRPSIIVEQCERQTITPSDLRALPVE